MVDSDEEIAKLLMEGASCTVARAKSGDYLAAQEIISQSLIVLRDFFDFDVVPSAHRMICLRALMASLVAIEDGVDPKQAMYLTKPPYRMADPDLAVKQIYIFWEVGRNLDEFLLRGHTRGDRPTKNAIQLVAKKNRLKRELVQKIWSMHGSKAGWEEMKADWK